jgi:hypothetical protein
VTYRLRDEGLEFLATAPYRVDVQAEVAAPPVAVFAAVAADPSTWSWFPGLTAGGYTGPGQPGVGSRRYVEMGGVTYRETMLAWDGPNRWAYRVDECTAPLFHALVEDWVVQGRGDTAIVCWTFAADPREEIAAVLPDMPGVLEGVFTKAMRNLSAILQA